MQRHPLRLRIILAGGTPINRKNTHHSPTLQQLTLGSEFVHLLDHNINLHDIASKAISFHLYTRPQKTLLPTILKTAGRSMQQYPKENKAKDKDPGEFS